MMDAEEFVARARAAMDSHDEWNRQVAAFALAARNVQGPLGVLLRTISVMHRSYVEDELAGHTTVAETDRMTQIVDDAIGATTYLTGMGLGT